MGQQVLVIGLGRFGSSLARTLHQLGHEVMAVDSDPRLVQDVADEVTHAVQADGTDREALEELGIADFHTAVVGISSALEPSILTTLNLRDLGCRYIIAKAGNRQHARILQRIGADRVVLPEHEMGVRLAHSFAARAVLDYLDLGPEYGIATVRLPKDVTGRTVGDLGLEQRYRLSLIAVVRGTEVLMHPPASERLRDGDRIVVAGRDEDLAQVQS